MSRFGGGEREEIFSQSFVMRGTIGPECTARRPIDAQSFVVSYSVLNDKSFNPCRMFENDAEAGLATQELVDVSFIEFARPFRSLKLRRSIPASLGIGPS